MTSTFRILSIAGVAGVVVAGPGAAEITLGAVLPLSGASAQQGLDQRRGIELALEKVNADGGVLGEDLDVIIEDSAGTPQAAIDAARKLVTVDQVPLVIGSYSSGVTLPMGRYLIEEGIPHINPASTSGLIRDIGAGSFSMVGLDNVSTEFAAQDVLDNGWERVALFAVNNAFGQGIAENFEGHFEEMGGEITLSILYEPSQSTYRRELQQLESTNPDAYVFTAYGSTGALIMQEAYELGLQQDAPWYSILITMMNSDTDPQFKEGLIGMDVGYVGEGGESYREDYQAAYGEGLLSAYGGYAHDAVLFAAEAIERAGGTDAEPLLAAIRDLGSEGMEGVTGTIMLDEDGQRMDQPYLQMRVDGDDLVVYEDGSD